MNKEQFQKFVKSTVDNIDSSRTQENILAAAKDDSIKEIASFDAKAAEILSDQLTAEVKVHTAKRKLGEYFKTRLDK